MLLGLPVGSQQRTTTIQCGLRDGAVAVTGPRLVPLKRLCGAFRLAAPRGRLRPFRRREVRERRVALQVDRHRSQSLQRRRIAAVSEVEHRQRQRRQADAGRMPLVAAPHRFLCQFDAALLLARHCGDPGQHAAQVGGRVVDRDPRRHHPVGRAAAARRRPPGSSCGRSGHPRVIRGCRPALPPARAARPQPIGPGGAGERSVGAAQQGDVGHQPDVIGHRPATPPRNPARAPPRRSAGDPRARPAVGSPATATRSGFPGRARRSRASAWRAATSAPRR